jgi:hypothetical protein
MREHSDFLFFTIYTGHRKRLSDQRPLVALTNRPTGKEVETLSTILSVSSHLYNIGEAGTIS